MTITEKLAAFIMETNLEDMPPEVITLTKRAMLDTLGVALAGSVQPAGKTITAFVQKFDSKRVAQVIGGRTRTSSPLAALANGTIAHILDYDDLKAGAQGHPSAVLMPVVLALGEELAASGKEVIEAYVLGIETEARISSIMPELHLKGWHPMGVLGTMSASAAAAKLLKLNMEETTVALGIASSKAAGLHRNFGTMTKALHAGDAAANGIIAALLAKEGFTANTDILDGDSSFPMTFCGSGAGAASNIVKNIGATYAIISPGASVKQYAVCGSSHRVVDAILHLIDLHDIKPEEVESVSCQSNPIVQKNLRYNDPYTALEGKFSMQFAVAVALTDHKIGLAQVTDEKVNDPAIKSLMKRVTLSVHPDWLPGRDKAENRADGVTVKLKNGSEYKKEVLVAKGSGKNPLAEEELLAKYRECAKIVLNDTAVERCINLVWGLEKLQNLRHLMQIVAG